MSEFARFGLDGPDPTWSSYALDGALDRSLASAKPEEVVMSVHSLLSHSDLTRAHASFIEDFVKGLLLRTGHDLFSADLGSMSIGSPAQALLAVHLIPDQRFDPELTLAVLSHLERTDAFDAAVIQLQDVVVRPDVARHLAASRPEIAARVRASLAQ